MTKENWWQQPKNISHEQEAAEEIRRQDYRREQIRAKEDIAKARNASDAVISDRDRIKDHVAEQTRQQIEKDRALTALKNKEIQVQHDRGESNRSGLAMKQDPSRTEFTAQDRLAMNRHALEAHQTARNSKVVTPAPPPKNIDWGEEMLKRAQNSPNPLRHFVKPKDAPQYDWSKVEPKPESQQVQQPAQEQARRFDWGKVAEQAPEPPQPDHTRHRDRDIER